MSKIYSNYPTTTGATISTYNGFVFYSFNTSGSITFANDLTTQVLVIGGGGGGGGATAHTVQNRSVRGGGGGAGEMVYGNVSFVQNSSYTITVGSGGTSSTNGTNSSLTGHNVNIIANGGEAGKQGKGATPAYGGDGGNTYSSGITTGFNDYKSYIGNGEIGSSTGVTVITTTYYYGGNGGGAGGTGTPKKWINNVSYADGGVGTTATNSTEAGSGGKGGGYTYSYLGASNTPGYTGVNGVIVIAVPLFTSTFLTYNNLSLLPPPGSITSYLGAADPPGWVICDGMPRTSTDSRYAQLLILGIGSGTENNYTPPDYRGAFLRGTGTGGGYSGPGINANQTDGYPSHTHSITDPGHTHTITDPGHNHTQSIGSRTSAQTGGNWTGVGTGSEPTGRSNTGITVNSSNTGITSTNEPSGGNIILETRPFNFGVNWILKL